MNKLRFLALVLSTGLLLGCNDQLLSQSSSSSVLLSESSTAGSPSNSDNGNAKTTNKDAQANPSQSDDSATTNKDAQANPSQSDDSATTNNDAQANPSQSDDSATTNYNTANPIQLNSLVSEIPHIVIVAAPDFMESLELKKYIAHKMKQGYQVNRIPAEDKTAEQIRQELKTFYQNLNGKPMAVVLVGDHVGGQTVGKGFYVPAFESTIDKSHPTDYYYGEYDGDYGIYDGKTGTYGEAWLQDAVVGRVSVSNTDELQAYVDKIIYMEENIQADEQAVTRVIRTSNDLNGIQTRAIGKYLSLFPKLTIEPIGIFRPSSLSESINKGAGFVVYTGHGLETSWSGWFTNSHADNLTNKVYPLVIASTCLSGSYQYNSLAEAFINNKHGGAIAYIGASEVSYAGHNRVMTTGSVDGSYTSKPGLVGALYYEASTDKKYRARTIGEALQAGHRALYRANYNSFVKSVDDTTKYSVEIYNLLGDPTYMPYTQAPKALKLSFDNKAISKGRNFVVQAAPEAQVAITRQTNAGVEIIATAYANEDGKAVLSIPDEIETTEADLYAIAPNYIASSQKIEIRENTGTKNSIATLNSIRIGTNSIAVKENTNNYSVAVAYEESFVKVSVETSDPLARVIGDGTHHLKPGLNKLTLTVIAEDGIKVNNYDIIINRKETTKSKDATLKSITVTFNGQEQVLKLSEGSAYDYDLHIPSNVQRIEVKAVPTNSAAKLRIEGADTDIPIVEGYPHYYAIYVKVTPEFIENGEITYTIKVYKNDK